MAISAVSSSEPSSTTMISIGRKVCARALPIARSIVFAARYAGMTTLTELLVAGAACSAIDGICIR